jgi:hypothetical protein
LIIRPCNNEEMRTAATQKVAKQESEGHPTILQQNWMLPTDKHALGAFDQSGGIDP